MKLNNMLDNKIVSFSFDVFKTDVINHKVCFLCGVILSKTNRTKEHIIPRWLIKMVEISNQKVVLSNLSKQNYDTYTIPCCQKCNNEILSADLEVPISRLFEKDFNYFKSLMRDINNQKLLYIWACFISVKTFLKDCQDDFELDNRKKNHEKVKVHEVLNYNLKYMKQNLEIVRSVYLKKEIRDVKIDNLIYGSFVYFQLDCNSKDHKFDYFLFSKAQTIGVCIKDIGFIFVLDDGGELQKKIQTINHMPVNDIAPEYYMLYRILKRIKNMHTSHVNYMQFRELIAHFATLNLHLYDKPIGYTLYNKKRDCILLKKKRISSVKLFYANKKLHRILLVSALKDFLNKGLVKLHNGYVVDEEDILKSDIIYFTQ